MLNAGTCFEKNSQAFFFSEHELFLLEREREGGGSQYVINEISIYSKVGWRMTVHAIATQVETEA